MHLHQWTKIMVISTMVTSIMLNSTMVASRIVTYFELRLPAKHPKPFCWVGIFVKNQGTRENHLLIKVLLKTTIGTLQLL